MRCVWVGRSAIWLLPLLLPGGCSLGIQGPSPTRPTGTPPSCTAKKTAVTADWIGAGAGLSFGVASADSSARVAAALLAGGGLFAWSAIAGNRRVNQCRDAYEAYFAERGIETPDSYGDYAVIADREAKRLRRVVAAQPARAPEASAADAVPAGGAASAPPAIPTGAPANAADTTQPSTAPGSTDAKTPIEPSWHEFWSEQP